MPSVTLSSAGFNSCAKDWSKILQDGVGLASNAHGSYGIVVPQLQLELFWKEQHSTVYLPRTSASDMNIEQCIFDAVSIQPLPPFVSHCDGSGESSDGGGVRSSVLYPLIVVFCVLKLFRKVHFA